jgi:hypothetical protein
MLDNKVSPWLLDTHTNPNDLPDCLMPDLLTLIGIVPKARRIDGNRR